MTPPPPPLLDYTVLYYILQYIGVQHVTMNISIRHSIKWVKYCCSYLFCYKAITYGQILEFEVSIESYLGVIFDTGI